MKRFTVAIFIAAALLLAGFAIAQDPIPADKEYIIKMAVYSLALDKIDTIGTTPATVTEYCDLMLARAIVRAPGSAYIALAEFAQASRPNADVDWSSVTFSSAKTVIGGVWSDLAYQKYGPEPVLPE